MFAIKVAWGHSTSYPRQFARGKNDISVVQISLVVSAPLLGKNWYKISNFMGILTRIKFSFSPTSMIGDILIRFHDTSSRDT